jgi:hypothetical protein
MATRIAGFGGEFLWELEIAERQIVAITESGTVGRIKGEMNG